MRRAILLAVLLVSSPAVSPAADGPVKTVFQNEDAYTPSRNPKAVLAYNAGCNALYRDSDVASAKVHFSKALELDPKFIHALDNLGTCHRRDGNLDEAAKCYKRSIALFPKGIFARANLALVHRASGKLDAAMEEYETCKRLDPENPEPYYGLALVELDAGKYDSALENAQAALDRYRKTNNPNASDAELVLAEIRRLKSGSQASER